MGILMQQVNRYLSLIEIPLSQEGRLKGRSEKTTLFLRPAGVTRVHR
jgi:hypothetical protein